jgi:predicted ArsR family transcriptional regulator
MPEKNFNSQSAPKSTEKASSSKSSLWSELENPFHCSWECHFRFMNSRFAPLLYSWGCRLSAKSDSFYPSAVNIAKHFYCDRTTVLRALKELTEDGWAEVVHKEAGKPVTYRLIRHEEWARNHPDRCVVKDTMPWEGEGDPLAKKLHATSGGLAKFMPGQMKGLRIGEFSDEQIESEFRIFLDRNPHKGREWSDVYYHFRTHLLDLVEDLRKVVDKNSSSEVLHARNTHQSHACNTPSGTGATPTSRTRATQVVELNLERGKEGEHTIPPPALQERSLALPTLPKVLSEKERQNLFQKQKALILRTYAGGSNER